MRVRCVLILTTIILSSCSRQSHKPPASHDTSNSIAINTVKHDTAPYSPAYVPPVQPPVAQEDSLPLPFLDTVIHIHYHPKAASEPKPLTMNEGRAIVEHYFESRGWLLDRKNYRHLDLEHRDYPSIDFDTIIPLGPHHPAQYIAQYWAFLYARSSHCSQPHYSLLAWNGHSYDLIQRDFMSEFYYADSLSYDAKNDYIYGVDDDCGGRGILRKFRAMLRYN